MTGQEITQADVPDVRKSVTVGASVEDAFRIFAERPIEWLPPGHTFLPGPRSITMEPTAGGRFYERGADGREVTRGIIVEWAPPGRLVMTWRIGANWQPLPDDEKASLIEVEFRAAGPDTTEVVVTNTQLHRHGAIAAQIRSALDGPSPGETLAAYAGAVARHTRPRGREG